MIRRSTIPAALPDQIVVPMRTRSVSLNQARITRGVFLFATVALFLLAHVALRFVTIDMKVQHRRLQEVARGLELEEQRLMTRSQVLLEQSHLREAAFTKLNLRQSRPDARVTAQVSNDLLERYAPRPNAWDPSVGESATQERGIASALASFFDVGVASATAAPIPVPTQTTTDLSEGETSQAKLQPTVEGSL